MTCEAGNCIVGCGFAEKNPPNREVVALVIVLAGLEMGGFRGSEDERVGRLCCFPGDCSKLGSLKDTESGVEDVDVRSGSMPTVTGADDPVNHEAIPPFDLSASLMTPSLSPVSVGINASTSNSGRDLSLMGEGIFASFRSGLREVEIRKGSKDVSDR